MTAELMDKMSTYDQMSDETSLPKNSLASASYQTKEG